MMDPACITIPGCCCVALLYDRSMVVSQQPGIIQKPEQSDPLQADWLTRIASLFGTANLFP